MEESKTSVQGRVIRDLIARFASDNLIGRKLKTGELRKKMVEPAWKCPDCFLMQKIKMPQFEMELLTSMQNPREDKVVSAAAWWRVYWKNAKCLPYLCRTLQ